MSETTTAKTRRKIAADYEALADQLLTDMRHLEMLMQVDQSEIDRLKAETYLLREESRRLEAETQASLSRLKRMFV